MDREALDKSMELLLSLSSSLKELAVMSGHDPFSFYNGADLRSLDLRGQDPVGLNFDSADLRFSILSDIKYQKGAFNKSRVDKEFMELQDTFLFGFREVIEYPSSKLLMFAQFRAGFIDKCLDAIGDTYSDFAEGAAISTASLRKARNERVVAIETAQAIAKSITSRLDKSPTPEILEAQSLTRQPNVRFVVGGNNGPFRPLTKERLIELLAFREYRINANLSPTLNYSIEDYRETADNLEYWERRFVEEGEYPFVRSYNERVSPFTF